MKAHTRCLTKRVGKKTVQTKKQKKNTPRIEASTSFSQGVQTTFEPPVSLHDISQIDIYLDTPIHTWDILTKKTKQHPSEGDDESMSEVARGRVDRDEHGEARRANTTPNGGPHLELGHLRLKTCSKSDFSIAETTWPTHLYKNYMYTRLPFGGGYVTFS